MTFGALHTDGESSVRREHLLQWEPWMRLLRTFAVRGNWMRKKKEARAGDGGWKFRGQRNRNRKRTGRKGIPQGNSLGSGQVNHVPQPDKTVTGIPGQSQATYWLSPQQQKLSKDHGWGRQQEAKVSFEASASLGSTPQSSLWDGYIVGLRILFSWHLFKKYLSPGLFCHSPSAKVGMEFSKMYIVSRLLLTLNTKCPLHPPTPC